MRTKNIAIFMSLSLLLLSSCSLTGSRQSSTAQLTPEQKLAQEQAIAMQKKLDQYAPGWSTESRSAAKEAFEKYGDPTEVTPSMLIWKFAAPFKRITVYKEGLTHRFPILHMDVVEHVVDFKVPADKADDLANFDGSILVDITRGEMSARSDQESMNILALNLASEIIRGDLRASQARIEYGKRSMEFMNGVKGNYTESLLFGRQIQTVNADTSISDKIRWVQAEEETPRRSRPLHRASAPVKKTAQPHHPPLLRQAQEELAE